MVVFLYRLTDGNEYLFQAKDDVSFVFLIVCCSYGICVDVQARKKIAAKSSGVHVSCLVCSLVHTCA